MSVVLDRASAERLLAEGAICFDTDTNSACCDGVPVRLPSGFGERCRPILICGTSERANTALVGLLQDRGLPAWQVLGLVPADDFNRADRSDAVGAAVS